MMRAALAPRRHVRLHMRLLLVIVPLAVVAAFLPLYHIGSALAAARAIWGTVLIAAFLYGISHVARAVRLAILAAPSLNMHIRTVALLQFYTAPVSFIVPYKVGELFRLQQLAWLSRDPVGALVVLLLERMLDALVLTAVLAGVVVVEGTLPPHMDLFAALLAGATVLGLFAIFVAPGALRAIQAHILGHHSAPSALRLLRLVASARSVVNVAAKRLVGNLALLLSLSALIWGVESSIVVLLAQRLQGKATMFLTSLLTMTISPRGGGIAAETLTDLYVAIGLAVLMLIWPVATALYLQRIRFPRRSVPSDPRPLSSRRARRIHLRTPRVTL